VLDTSPTFTAGGTPGKWGYKAFYQDIVKMIDEDMPADLRQKLFDWYDRYLHIPM
jgi:hypothetical protein